MYCSRSIKTRLAVIAVALLGLVVSGCIYEVGLPADGDTTFSRFVPIQGMHQQNRYSDQQKQPMFRADQPEGMRYPPPKTIPVNGYLRPDAPSLEDSQGLTNPVTMTKENLEYGKFLYDEQCAVCHGMDGHGQGTIVEADHFPPPPTLSSDSLRNAPDSTLYHIMTYGQGLMWAYDNNLTEMERWAVANYIRALQRADRPEPMDLDRVRQN